MKEIVGLMFSGGVDSIVCLKILREKGITPILFHVATKKRKYERQIKKIARIMSPESPYYSWKAKIYKANGQESNIYSVFCKASYDVYFDEGREGIFIRFSDFVDKLVIGYFKRDHTSQREALERYMPRYSNLIFPLAEMSGKQINEIWETLPDEIKELTVSSSRDIIGSHKFPSNIY